MIEFLKFVNFCGSGSCLIMKIRTNRKKRISDRMRCIVPSFTARWCCLRIPLQMVIFGLGPKEAVCVSQVTGASLHSGSLWTAAFANRLNVALNLTAAKSTTRWIPGLGQLNWMLVSVASYLSNVLVPVSRGRARPYLDVASDRLFVGNFFGCCRC